MTTARLEELAMWREYAVAWEAVARNMAQVLSNTLHQLEREDGMGDAELEELRNTFRAQCEAHGVTP